MANLVKALEKIGRKVSLGVDVAGVVAPLISGVVATFRKITRKDGVIEYHVVIEQGGENIAQSEADARSTIDLVNVELDKLGQPPLEIPD